MDNSEESRRWLQLTTSRQFDTGVGNGNSIASSDQMMVSKEKMQIAHLSIFVESLVEQFSRILQKNPKEQQKTYRAICSKLKELSLVNGSYLHEELASLRSHYSSAILTFHQSPSLHSPITETSRYATEYEEIGWIESGGFGDVFRVRNKLDQQEYAVKKIKVKYKGASPFLRTIAEVKTLARLNHTNIVQYKAAWLEIGAVSEAASQNQQQPDLTDFSDDVVFEHSETSQQISETSNDEISSQALCRFQPPTETLSQPGADLYVCMELCNETLRQWLDRRNEVNVVIDVGVALSIAHQAASGIHHIHNFQITHHDIKPSNIFITSDMRVMVGDFGLACTSEGDVCPVERGQFGTPLYAAPEQLLGQCQQKSDIFSLGLVMLELLLPFSTAMERVHVLKKARLNKIPHDLPTKLQDFLSSITDDCVDKRPSAHDVLSRLTQLGEEVIGGESGIVETCDKDKDLLIQRLQQELAEKADQIKQLNQSLNLLQINPKTP